MVSAVDRSPSLPRVSGGVTFGASAGAASRAGQVSWRTSPPATERAGARRRRARARAAATISRTVAVGFPGRRSLSSAPSVSARRSRATTLLLFTMATRIDWRRSCTAGTTAKPMRRRCRGRTCRLPVVHRRWRRGRAHHDAVSVRRRRASAEPGASAVAVGTGQGSASGAGAERRAAMREGGTAKIMEPIAAEATTGS